MNDFDDIRASFATLDALRALRDGLGYLRSISACFQGDEEDRDRLFALIASRTVTSQGGLDTREFDKLLFAYLQMIVALHASLLYSALEHYGDLAKSNPELRHQPLDVTVRQLRECGLYETLRRLRNAVFHVKPGESIDELVAEVRRLSIEMGKTMREIEDQSLRLHRTGFSVCDG